MCAQVLMYDPGNEHATQILGMVSDKLAMESAQQRFTGPVYQKWLSFFHDFIRPEGYIEIGVADGNSLQYVNPSTKAIGVDPAYVINKDIRSWSKLFKIESDQFFMDFDPKEELGHSLLDFAFIDGLHTFDQALKDFINIEKESHEKTVIVFHDIYPVDPISANRQRLTNFWLGDTWKVIPIIRKYRPELTVFTIPTYPSGLGVVTGLNPSSTVLETHFDEIVATYMTMLDEDVMAPEQHLNVVQNDFQYVSDQLNVAWGQEA